MTELNLIALAIARKAVKARCDEVYGNNIPVEELEELLLITYLDVDIVVEEEVNA